MRKKPVSNKLWMTPMEAGRVLRERSPAIVTMLKLGILSGDWRTGRVSRRQVEAFAAARHERRKREREARLSGYPEKNEGAWWSGDRGSETERSQTQ